MELTIKKASDIRQLAIVAVESIKLQTTVTVSVYSENDPVQTVADASTKIQQQVADIMSLLDVAANIKLAIGEKNDAVGVTRLLRDGARLESKINKMQLIIKSFDGLSRSRLLTGSATQDFSTDSSALRAKVASIRARLNNPELSHNLEEEFSVDAVSQQLKDAFADQLAELKRQKLSVSDNIAALNSTHKITISPQDEDALKRFKIL